MGDAMSPTPPEVAAAAAPAPAAAVEDGQKHITDEEGSAKTDACAPTFCPASRFGHWPGRGGCGGGSVEAKRDGSDGSDGRLESGEAVARFALILGNSGHKKV